MFFYFIIFITNNNDKDLDCQYDKMSEGVSVKRVSVSEGGCISNREILGFTL